MGIQTLQRLGQVGPCDGARALDQVFVFHDLDISQGHGGAGRVTGIGVAVDEIATLLNQNIDDLFGNADRRDRQIA